VTLFWEEKIRLRLFARTRTIAIKASGISALWLKVRPHFYRNAQHGLPIFESKELGDAIKEGNNNCGQRQRPSLFLRKI